MRKLTVFNGVLSGESFVDPNDAEWLALALQNTSGREGGDVR